MRCRCASASSVLLHSKCMQGLSTPTLARRLAAVLPLLQGQDNGTVDDELCVQHRPKLLAKSNDASSITVGHTETI